MQEEIKNGKMKKKDEKMQTKKGGKLKSQKRIKFDRSHLLQVFQIPIESLKNSDQSNHIALEVVTVRMEEVKFLFFLFFCK